ncbi:MAG TPA: sulfurtransferase TusA family protein [Clostridia bacterium]|nr:sulfurtransferase TusA family protein [Clostridia bacterium]
MLSLKLNQIDARGLSCPQPVLLTKKGVERNPEGIQVLVDNTIARDNITRFAGNSGYKVDTKTQGSDFLLTLTK